MEVRAELGDSVTGAFITLADLSLATLDTYFDETDLDKVIAGNEVEVVFDALPDLVFTGHLVRVDPSLTQSMNSSLLHAVAVLDGENPQDLSRMPSRVERRRGSHRRADRKRLAGAGGGAARDRHRDAMRSSSSTPTAASCCARWKSVCRT